MARPSKLHFHKGVWESTIGGKSYYFGTDETKARRAFHRLMAERLREKPSDGTPETIAGAATAWLALNDRECYRRWLKPLGDFAAGIYLDEVERDLLTKYALFLRGVKVAATDKPLSLKSVRHSVFTAATMLRWAHGQGWLETMPDVPKLPKPSLVARDIPRARLGEILASIRKGPRRILEFIAATGCRPSEACNLQWAHVRFDMGACILPTHKTAASGAGRTLYLTPDADRILRSLTPGDGHVFATRKGKPYTSDLLRKIMHRRGANTYALRHSFAQRCIDDGVPVEVVAGLLGHASTETTRTYAQVRSNRLAEVAGKLRLVS